MELKLAEELEAKLTVDILARIKKADDIQKMVSNEVDKKIQSNFSNVLNSIAEVPSTYIGSLPIVFWDLQYVTVVLLKTNGKSCAKDL